MLRVSPGTGRKRLRILIRHEDTLILDSKVKKHEHICQFRGCFLQHLVVYSLLKLIGCKIKKKK